MAVQWLDVSTMSPYPGTNHRAVTIRIHFSTNENAPIRIWCSRMTSNSPSSSPPGPASAPRCSGSTAPRGTPGKLNTKVLLKSHRPETVFGKKYQLKTMTFLNVRFSLHSVARLENYWQKYYWNHTDLKRFLLKKWIKTFNVLKFSLFIAFRGTLRKLMTKISLKSHRPERILDKNINQKLLRSKIFAIHCIPLHA